MTLRRFLAALCIVSIAGSFSLRLACETSCENGAPRTIPHCHKVVDTGATVSQAPDCGKHDADPAIAEARRTTGSMQVMALPVAAFAMAQTPSSDSHDAAEIVDTSPPRTSRALALRI